MKTTMLTALAVIMSTTVQADSSERTVTVCFDHTNADDTPSKAQTIASQVFRDIGVNIQWHESGHFCQTHQNQVIVISLSTQTPRSLLPGAMAYALPYEGVHIEVFYDRMTIHDSVEPALLAYVLVHEITHILEGINRHSASGIMMAHWDREDYLHMKTKSLTFTAEDVEFINRGLAVRASSAGLLAAR
jgi:hypothetical protein